MKTARVRGREERKRGSCQVPVAEACSRPSNPAAPELAHAAPHGCLDSLPRLQLSVFCSPTPPAPFYHRHPLWGHLNTATRSLILAPIVPGYGCVVSNYFIPKIYLDGELYIFQFTVQYLVKCPLKKMCGLVHVVNFPSSEEKSADNHPP